MTSRSVVLALVVLAGCSAFTNLDQGKMDDARIFERALTDVEVKALYEGRACD